MLQKPCPLLPVQDLALDVHICRTVLGDGSFQRCTDSCVSISLTHLQPWSAVMLGDMWRWAAEQINNRNTFAYTCEDIVPSIGAVHAASPAGTDRTGLRDTETCSALSRTCMTTDRLLHFAFSYFYPPVKWDVCDPVVGN